MNRTTRQFWFVLSAIVFSAINASADGTPTKPVSKEYAAAFLQAILPQLSDFVAKASLNIPIPITTNQIVGTNYLCRILDGQPIAQLYLTNGDRFNYEHGHVEAFYAHDAMDKFPENGNPADFLGHINISTNEAISLCAEVIKKMGYANKLSAPIISHALSRGTLACTRYSYYWRHPGDDFPFASFEVDMETKVIKTAYLKDAAFQKESPKIPFPP